MLRLHLRKDYLALYVHAFGDSFAESLFYFFSGAYFYTLGMPLHFILLFFGLEFGLRGVLSPFGLVATARLGVGRTLLVSYAFMTCFFVAMAAAPHSLAIGFFSFVFFSAGRAAYYQCLDGIHSRLVRNEDRGRQRAMESLFHTAAQLIGVVAGSVILSRFSYGLLVILAVLVFMGAAMPFFLMLGEVHVERRRAREIVRYAASPGFGENHLPLAGYALGIITFYVLVPLFVFLIAGEFEGFGLIMGTAIAVEMLAVLAFGWAFDVHGNARMVRFASVGKIAGDALYLFLPQAILLVNTYNRTVWKMLESGANNRIDRKGLASGDPFLFATAVNMTLCAVEIVVLPLLAVVAFLRGNAVFTAGFLLSVLGVFLFVRYFRPAT